MSKNPIKDELHRKLGELLLPSGYKFQKLDNDVEGFMRQVHGVRQMIFAALWDHAPVFEFAIGLGMRVEAVESISNLFSGVLPKYQASSDTCVIHLKTIVPSLERLTVYDDATIQQAVDQLAPHITQEVLPFLNSHMDVKSLDRLMNQGKEPQQVWGREGRGSWLFWFARSAVILARLAQNPDFDKLVERYRQELHDFDNEDRERYEKLVEHLRSLP